MPDELLEHIDRSAERTGRTWQAILSEMLAYYTVKELDRKATENCAAIDAYFGQK